MKTLKLRIKDKHAKILTELAGQVNFVWNYVNELSFKYLKKHQKFLSAYDIYPYIKGASKECDLHSHTIQAVSEEYATRRKQFKKARLRWRSFRRSLGWIPFKKASVKYGNGWVSYRKHTFGVWFEEVDEKYTTQTCSCCGATTDNSPKGRAGLRIREWTCSACNTTHDRDINAAKNILRIGRDTLVGGVPHFNKEKMS